MAPPNRGVSKAVLPQSRQILTRAAATPAPSSLIANNNNNNSSRSAITIPYPCASAGSLESTANSTTARNNQLLRSDPSLSYIGGFDPFIAPADSTSLSSDPQYSFSSQTTTPAAVFPDYQHLSSTFSSPISPPGQQSYLSESESLGNLFQHNQSLEEATMFTDTSNTSSSPHGPNSAHSQEPNYHFADAFSPSSMNATHSPYGPAQNNSAFMYNPTEPGAYSAGPSSLSSSDEMETDGANNNTTATGGAYLYNFPDVSISTAPSPQPQDDDGDYIPPPPKLGHGSKSPSSPFASTMKTPTSASSKEKEQNKQKLYRNRKSEFTNRMRDELLAMNLLPHSRITHAPEIMSKTADTLRDYRELLLLIRESVDGMPENLASVPGAVRKLLNEGGHVFNNNNKPPVIRSHPQQHPKATDYKTPPTMLHVTPIQPLPFRATNPGVGRQGSAF